MRVVTWNVNSIRQRLPRLLALLDRHEPDVVCLQETKVIDDDFPFDELSAVGYHALSYGQRAYNGVAVLALEPLEEISRGMPDDPCPLESRLLAARTGGIAVASVYAVNGKAIDTPSYEVKLAWYEALREWTAATFDPSEPYVLAGDFNIAPGDRDIHDPSLWEGKNHASVPERQRLGELLGLGLTDLGRAVTPDDGSPGPFTWWDYRMGAFHRGWGLRIDLLLGSKPVADRLVSVEVDREERKPSTGEGKPSDHAPVILTLRD